MVLDEIYDDALERFEILCVDLGVADELAAAVEQERARLAAAKAEALREFEAALAPVH